MGCSRPSTSPSTHSLSDTPAPVLCASPLFADASAPTVIILSLYDSEPVLTYTLAAGAVDVDIAVMPAAQPPLLRGGGYDRVFITAVSNANAVVLYGALTSTVPMRASGDSWLWLH